MISDYILFDYFNLINETETISMLKGLFFVIITAYVIYTLLRNDMNKIREINNNLTISNDYYYTLFKNNHVVSLLIDPDTYQIIDANKAAYSLYGYSKEAFLSKKLTDLSVTHTLGDIKSPEMDYQTMPQQVYMKSAHITAANNLIEVELYMGPIRLKDKVCFLALINDISEKNRMENALIESEQKYKKLVENIPDVFYVFSMKKGLIFISPQIKSLIGYSPTSNEKLPDLILNHIFSEDKKNFLQGRKSVFESFEQFENNYRIVDSNKTVKWILDRVFLVTPQNDDIIIEGVLSDITEKRKLVEELMLAHAKSNESLKLKSVILSNLNHELRTPLNGIIGFSKLIQRNSKEPEIQEFVDLVLESAYRLNSTLNSLLTLNEIEAGHRDLIYEVTSIKEYLKIIYDSNFKLVERKGLEFKLVIREDIKFYTDTSILSQVFFNLIDNAIKFTKSGSITLQGEFVSKNGMWIKLSVIDTGVGINPDYYQAMFHPFTQGSGGISRKFDGLGIGLTICFKLAALLKGKIEVESEPDKGSTFMIYLPFKVQEELEES